MKGLRLDIYRHKDYFSAYTKDSDCSAGGISARCYEVTLVGPGIDEIFDATPDAPAVKLVRRVIGGAEYMHVEPVEPVKEGYVGYCAGGTLVYTTDSRFPSRYPLSLHDRQDTAADYEALSR